MLGKARKFLTKEIPNKWAIAFVVIIIILFVLYNFAQNLIMPEWMLPNIFYAFMTAIFGFAFWIAGLFLRDYFEIGKMKKARKREGLDTLKGEYSRCEWSIGNNIQEYIAKNKRTDFTARLYNIDEMGKMKVSEELQKELQKYNEESRDFNIFQKASENHIRNTIEAGVRRMFPKTAAKGYDLNIILCSDFLMVRYFNGETVTESWLKETEPGFLKNIVKEIVESERYELDVLFNETNKEFQKEEILLRFREQKKTLMEHGKAISERLKKEIALLDKELVKYDYLKVSEPARG
jgi:hypothetical protein